MQRVIEKLHISEIPLISTVTRDEFISASEIAFDCKFDGHSLFYPWVLPKSIPNKFKIGVIVGSSGSGKSTLLKEFGAEETPIWDSDKSIISHFETPEDGISKLSSVGLNSVPSWYKPYHVLSNGEKFRADLARKIKPNAVIDEYTSVVDRNVAKAASVSLSRYIKNNDVHNIVLSTCHRDILDWLEPDWVIDTDSGELIDGFFFVRPQIKLDVYRTSHDSWRMFGNHHYLDANVNKAARFYIGIWDGNVVAFGAAITMPNGAVKNAWRGHRTVVLPDFQGMGIGVRFSDMIAKIHLNEGHRYFSRTAHPRMGEYREKSPLWKPTSKNKKLRTDVKHENVYNNHFADNKRVCYSHEYIGIKKEG